MKPIGALRRSPRSPRSSPRRGACSARSSGPSGGSTDRSARRWATTRAGRDSLDDLGELIFQIPAFNALYDALHTGALDAELAEMRHRIEDGEIEIVLPDTH
jgi:hypothetical protein